MRIEEVGPAVLINADCRDAMRAMDETSVDTIVCDPPYGLKFMGKGWDHGVPGEEYWIEALRVAKPGAHLLAFGGTRTFHRLMVAIEDSGWEIRDTIMWVYGSGFPKSLNVQQAINKAAAGHPQGGADPTSPNHGKFKGGCSADNPTGQGFGAGAAAFMDEQGEARGGDEGPWEGWGTALKPAWEPVIVARKPLVGTVAANVLEHGTGAMNIDGCRVGPGDAVSGGGANFDAWRDGEGRDDRPAQHGVQQEGHTKGRWPANLIHDGSDDVLALFPDSNGSGGSLPNVKITGYGDGAVGTGKSEYFGGPRTKVDAGSGSAARFFYCAKTSKKDRNEGLDTEPDKVLARSCQAAAEAARGNTVETEGGAFNKARVVKNNHPTVKPTELMRYLCRLVTPPGGTVLDPFMGSGSTGKAALKEGFSFVGIDNDEEHGYFDIACARIKAAV